MKKGCLFPKAKKGGSARRGRDWAPLQMKDVFIHGRIPERKRKGILYAA